jgi:hypothetical protein
MSFRDRLRYMMIKSDNRVDDEAEAKQPKSLEELEAESKSADDKERMIGLIAAPLAAIIGIVITNHLVADDPTGSKHVNPSYYHELTLVLLGMSVLLLVSAWFRKRLFMGILLALYGLAIFNLHYWGFGVPFLLAGSWYLVRSYRIQRAVREAGGGASAGGSTTTGSMRPKPNKRYTPPTAPPKRSNPPDQDGGKKAS